MLSIYAQSSSTIVCSNWKNVTDCSAHNCTSYGYGKQLARLAQLAHIVSKLAESGGNNNTQNTGSSDRLLTLKQHATEKLSYFLDLLLAEGGDSLIYDASLGGLVSADGLADKNADFGNGRYNGTYHGGPFSWGHSLGFLQALSHHLRDVGLQIITSTMATFCTQRPSWAD